MDLGRPTTTSEAQALIVMVQYYRDMWPMLSYLIAPLEEVAISPKGIKTL